MEAATPSRKLNRVPRATYRLQFNTDFALEQASEILDYLEALGISDVYAAPILTAVSGSTHGYDVCDFEQVNPALGGATAFSAFTERLQSKQMGLLLDMVPNHMGADLSNPWWHSVLEHGAGSPFAGYFDINWQSGGGKVLLPILEDHYSRVLHAGKLRLGWSIGRFIIRYYDRELPVSLEGCASILERVLRRCCASRAATELIHGLETLLEVLTRGSTDEALSGIAEFERIKEQLRRWHSRSCEFSLALRETIDGLNGAPGRPDSFSELHELLQKQHYRLAYWRVGNEELNYRRFFDVTQLAGLRMELPEVFDMAHKRISEWVSLGLVTGLRIDHPDGLRDPGGYLRTLQDATRAARPPQTDLYVVVEKILTGPETLRKDWPCAGTTGYDFLNQLNAVFVASWARADMDRIYQEFTGLREPLSEVIYRSKKRVLEELLIGEWTALSRQVFALAKRTRSGCDLTFSTLRRAQLEVIACFPAYRSYADIHSQALPKVEQAWIQEALAKGRSRAAGIDPLAFTWLEDLLLGWGPNQTTVTAEERAALAEQALEVRLRFQQLTGPVMAKGLEDTAFYNYNRLISLNEVGGDPDVFGITVEAFHKRNLERLKLWPHSLLATATHDTKRGEDVRARINVLSELAPEWDAAVQRWHKLNEPGRSVVRGEASPSPNDEYLIYQTLIGSWPLAERPVDRSNYCDRVCAYVLKAIKESKANTSWLAPNEAYEMAVIRFLKHLLNEKESGPFLEDFQKIQRITAFFGMHNSLSQLVLKLTCPGVPDIYQGTEFVDLSLVDPDNRRPVDYQQRRVALSETLLQDPGGAPDRLKFHVLHRLLLLRRQNPEVFASGSYEPLQVEGEAAEHVIAFARRFANKTILVLAGRLIRTLMNKNGEFEPGSKLWKGTRITSPCFRGNRFTEVFAGKDIQPIQESLELDDAFGHLPVAVLMSADQK
jgi:(1->4)-alpha-D-glucan 1-alpha-D-glucosylmutase